MHMERKGETENVQCDVLVMVNKININVRVSYGGRQFGFSHTVDILAEIQSFSKKPFVIPALHTKHNDSQESLLNSVR